MLTIEDRIKRLEMNLTVEENRSRQTHDDMLRQRKMADELRDLRAQLKEEKGSSA